MLHDFELDEAPDPPRKEQVEEFGYCYVTLFMVAKTKEMQVIF